MQYDSNSRRSVAIIVALGSLAAAILILAPAIVGAYITQCGFSPQQAGYLISADMAGMGLATLPALFWVKRVDWRHVARVALLLAAAGNVLTAGSASFESFVIVRFCTALAAGTAMSVCLASIGMTRDPDRVFGLWVVGQLALGAVGLALFPLILSAWGFAGVFLLLAGALFVLSFFVHHLPQRGPDPASSTGAGAALRRRLLLAACGVFGVLCFYVGLSGVWAFLERMGVTAQLDAGFISRTLSLASLAGIAGAASASFLSARRGRLLPAGAGFALILLALMLLLNRVTAEAYLLAACLFKYAWTFILPYLLASITAIDASGRVILVTNIMIGGGLAIGPAIAATLIGAGSYQPVVWLGLGFMCACLLLFLPLLLRRIPVAAAR